MINFKKTAWAVVALGTASVACAGMYEPPPGMMDEPAYAKHGPYFGIGLGALGFETQVTTQGTVTIDDVASRSVSGSGDGGNEGLNSYVLAGYGWTFPNKVFLGGEVFGNLTNAPVTINNSSSNSDSDTGVTTSSNANVNMTFDGDYGARLLPGYQVTSSSVVYGIVGYSRGYTSTTTTNTLTSSAGDSSGYELSSSDHYWFNGLQLGLGSMINVTNNIAFRGDLIWTGYEQQTLASASSSDAIGSAQSSITAQPITIEADVGLLYTFD